MKIDNLIILGAGKPVDPNSKGALTVEPFTNNTMLDWQLAAARYVFKNIIYVSGYNTEELRDKYPELLIVENKNWETTGPIGSLLCVEINNNESYVIQYGDTLLTSYPGEILQINKTDIHVFYHKASLTNLLDKEKVCFLNSEPVKFGYNAYGTVATFELCGLIGLMGETLKKLTCTDFITDENAPLSYLLEMQRITGGSLNCLPVGSEWIEINSEQDFARQVLGTKAETLQRLKSVLQTGVVLDQKLITYEDWKSRSSDIVNEVLVKFGKVKLIVRSSARAEDGFESAFDGVYDSILDVECSVENITEAVDKVFKSYIDVNPHNQVLIQPMLQDVKISGVLFTRTIDHAGPYITVNFDDQTGLTDTVTGGLGRNLKTLKLFKPDVATEFLNDWQSKLIEAVFEIEAFLHLDELDIEFALDSHNKVYIFQVRPIASTKEVNRHQDEVYEQHILAACEKYSSFKVADAPPTFGRMPDWNPAEIIGARPDMLSYSLYCSLITDNIWAKQRYQNGNVDLRGEKLMQSFCGQPFINVRNSVTSFVPRELEPALIEKIVSHALSIYVKNLNLHDKLEFEVIPTCFDLNMSKWQNLYVDGSGVLNMAEFDQWCEALIYTTKFQIDSINRYKEMSLEFDDEMQKLIRKSIPTTVAIRKTLLLLEELGTLSFAHLARCGFIAISILRSAVAKFPENQAIIEQFQTSIKTISTKYTNDLRSLKIGEITELEFTERYGHLRPSTYNIYSKSYKRSLNSIIPTNIPAEITTNRFTDHRVLASMLTEYSAKIGVDVNELVTFISEAIHWREQSKYIFTKGLSYILELLTEIDPNSLFSNGCIHYFTINELLDLLEGNMPDSQLAQTLNERRQKEELQGKIELPEVITKLSDFRIFKIGAHETNFIGGGAIEGELCELQINSTGYDLSNKIVLIESADPGYDWIFGHRISGLITEYGGANSHMAIRAAEYNIPAAIGIGPKTRESLRSYKYVLIDCRKKTLKGLS